PQQAGPAGSAGRVQEVRQATGADLGDCPRSWGLSPSSRRLDRRKLLTRLAGSIRALMHPVCLGGCPGLIPGPCRPGCGFLRQRYCRLMNFLVQQSPSLVGIRNELIVAFVLGGYAILACSSAYAPQRWAHKCYLELKRMNETLAGM